jgi:deazaflavin-dependent oxidoreductase (nitroreductase family)
MAWDDFPSLFIMNNGSGCSTPARNFANSLKKTSPSSSSKDSPLDREQYLYLTTRGRKSALPREIEIWFTAHEGRFYVVAEYPSSQWVQNLRACPEVTVRVAEIELQAHARILSSEAESELCHTVASLSRKKYGWGDGLIVELMPRSAEP